MVVYAGQGDPERTLALLWRTTSDGPPRRGPKPALTVDAILEAAIAVADESGLDGLSMRAVGERLGRTAMALYTYVPTKRELVDLMYDHAHAGLVPDLPSGWRDAVEIWALAVHERYLRHPWLLQVSHARPVLGPHEQTVLEKLLEALPDVAVRATVSALFSLVRGSARTIAESRDAATGTGTSDQEWWTARSGLMSSLVPDFAERFPRSANLPPVEWDKAAHEAFTGGLTLLLDGLENQTRRRMSPKAR
ncbi:TetR/AcrR family transcriptional regulator [Herbidospora cretacea]|uniref:TetR/AcrR family transcriptional regulator n=1 Tax=Herbidospora cretacea TaxID=28444 RepID=UPI000773CD11|nr:TetR/AcrR family transcriptional regulator [Herbidospora cretacea]